MVKVYIVTIGSYSHYRIHRVFLNKRKAKKYIAMNKGGWDEPRIEEYETDDETLFNEINYVDIDYTVKNNAIPQFIIRFIKSTTVDEEDYMDDLNYTYYTRYTQTNTDAISMGRIISNEYDKDYISKKYEKVCQDIYAQIQYQKSQGWTEEMISKWIKGKTKVE